MTETQTRPPTFEDLAQSDVWLCRGGETGKIPHCPQTGRKANDEASRVTRDVAEAGAKKFNLAGIGIRTGTLPGTDYLICGIDLDSAVEDGELTDAAREVVERFSSVTNLSLSGTGGHIYVLARVGDVKAVIQPSNTGEYSSVHSPKDKGHAEISFFGGGKFFVYSGKPLGPTRSLRVATRDDLDWFHNEFGPSYAPKDRKGQKARRSFKGKVDRSTAAFNMYRELAPKLGRDKAIEKLQQDDGPAGEWWREADQRQRDRVVQNAGSLIHELDEINRNYAFVMLGTTAAILHEDGKGSVEFLKERDFHAKLANKKVFTGGDKPVSISRVWFESPHRRQYARVVFKPGKEDLPNGEYNLWRGWAANPNLGDLFSCDRFLAHTRHICGGDDVAFDYLIKWLAHLVQAPWEKPGVAVVFRGGKGVGKDSWAQYVADMLGPQYCPTILQARHLTGNFNGHFENAIFVTVQEAVWAGSRSDGEALKGIITSDTMPIERKGFDTVTMKNVSRFFMSSNADWVVPASADERRYFVLEVEPPPDTPGGLGEYFDALHEERRLGGPDALLAYLMSIDLTDFDVRRAPQTRALGEQKLQSLRGFDRWWCEVLATGVLPGRASSIEDAEDEWEDSSVRVEPEGLRAAFADWLSRHRYQGEALNPGMFGRKIKAACPALETKRPRVNEGQRRRLYLMPRLDACRRAFEHYAGTEIDWEVGP